jgi:hypothetical protein
MNQQMFPVFLGLMIVATVAWLFLSRRLYSQLEKNHPAIYESLGKPKSVMRKSIRKNKLIIRFIFFDHRQGTDDLVIKKLCEGLRSIMIIYAICFLGCLVLLIDWLA